MTTGNCDDQDMREDGDSSAGEGVGADPPEGAADRASDRACDPERDDAWQDAGEPVQSDGSQLVVDVEGFEGPLDLLLALARTHKVDVSQISVLALAEQYLKFIEEAQRLRLEVAADYLVMAAWLAYLKSRLLLPVEENAEDQLSAQEMARRLSFRLMRLEAMRGAAAELMNRQRLGRDFFVRGKPEGFTKVRDTTFTAGLFDLLKAYALQRQRTIKVVHTVKRRTVWSIKDARKRLQRLLGEAHDNWVQLDLFIERYLPTLEETKTVRASSFGASLEMARDGLVELRQSEAFAPIYMRQRSDGEAGFSGWEQISHQQNENDVGETS